MLLAAAGAALWSTFRWGFELREAGGEGNGLLLGAVGVPFWLLAAMAFLRAWRPSELAPVSSRRVAVALFGVGVAAVAGVATIAQGAVHG